LAWRRTGDLSVRPGGAACLRLTASLTVRWEALRPHSVGVYVNFPSNEGAAGVQAAYGKRLGRLVALKDRYDPDNVFRSTPTSRQANDPTEDPSPMR
jgi:Berberine and berberine like